MLAKGALRRAMPLLAGRRGMAAAADVSEMGEITAKLATTLPDAFKPIAAEGPIIAAEIKAVYAAQPELMKAVEAKIAEADKPGVRATVAAAKAPNACKYTEEGTLVHSMMQQVAVAERRMEALAELEYTLTASDKEGLVKAYAAKAAEMGESDLKFSISDTPDKIKLGA